MGWGWGGFVGRSAISTAIAISTLAGPMSIAEASVSDPGESAKESADEPASSAGGFEIRWQTVDGGATLASGGDYQLRGTVGQPEADPAHPAESDDFTHTGGFWTILPLSGEAISDIVFRDRFGE